jgi:hypothetical protein
LYVCKGDGDGDPHDEIVRLEARIEEITQTIESCRKFILASRIVTWGGGIVLFAMLSGVMRFDPEILAAAVAALLGGSRVGRPPGWPRMFFLLLRTAGPPQLVRPSPVALARLPAFGEPLQHAAVAQRFLRRNLSDFFGAIPMKTT